MKNILVAVDFDTGQEVLIEKAREFAEGFNAKLWLLHVSAPDPEFVGYDAGPQSERDWRAAQLREKHRTLQAHAQELKAGGLKAEALLVQGPIQETILKEAEKLGIDLIIAGHNEHGLFYKAIIGSVTSRVIKKSRVPLLIVPLD